jgi:hypothetical protein
LPKEPVPQKYDFFDPFTKKPKFHVFSKILVIFAIIHILLPKKYPLCIYFFILKGKLFLSNKKKAWGSNIAVAA